MIVVCGLACSGCDIRRVPSDAAAAQRVVDWFRDQGWLAQDEGVTEIIQRAMYYKGCRGGRSVHWSPDCWILRCCVDEKGLEFCSKCEEFPCLRLQEWAQSGKYARALQRLYSMKASASA
jgi:hypothetical protein